jgi:uncharacterized repeat protein (TIGR03803 family)
LARTGSGDHLVTTSRFHSAHFADPASRPVQQRWFILRYSRTLLHSFNSKNGACPCAGLIQANDGQFYGATQLGGARNAGTIFMMSSKGKLSILHTFRRSDGINPNRLVQAVDGTFYGTTYTGEPSGYGTIFEFTPQRTLTTLHSFDSSDGAYPETGLLQGTDGTFNGTTVYGGTDNICPEGCGTIFSLSVGLGPFVETQTTSGKVGAAVKILGTDLTGATGVTFNGTIAGFTVNSTGTAISTTVPTGATTGTVQVVTPSATLSSNVPFRVP